MNPSFLRMSAVALALLAASPALAQEAVEEAEPVVTTTTEEGGSDWGWLGLLGLIGLAGLSGRRRDNVTTTTR